VISRTLRLRTTAIAVMLAGLLVLAACSSDANDTNENTAASSGDDTEMTTGASSTTGAMNGGTTDPAAQTFGDACSAVPADGAGSFDGMAEAPVATAASNNPVLSTLVQAVTEANLVDTLNGTQDITVFAPTNDAFAAVPTETLDAAMADPSGLLTTVLTYHVVPGQLAPEQLAGEHETLEGNTLKIKGSGDSFTVNGSASVVCGNVPTANATVYVIDGVLLPPSN
jgi:uncharacterized surface protein with fasciclin (FAS1) repeats